jgi:hypothetical protein
VFWDTFETIVLPRTVRRKVRLTNLVYQAAWSLVSRAARRMTPGGGARRSLLGAYGPLSLLLLVGVWTTGLVFGFALINFGLKSPVNAPEATRDFGTYLYASGVTLFTLGFGDVTPTTALARFLSVLEAGVGIGYFAIVISYLPVMYGEFSRREVNILLLDARAGSPPAASELLRRHGRTDGLDPNLDALTSLLKDFERWSAELLESYISYPILSFYRSQHEQQSWLGRADDHSRHLRARARRQSGTRRRSLAKAARVAGPPDLRARPARFGGPRLSAQRAAPFKRPRPFARRGVATAVRNAHARRPAAAARRRRGR